MNIRKHMIFCAIVVFYFPFQSSGQDKYMFGNKIFNLQFLYNYGIPKQDLAKSFGNFSTIGFGGMFKTKNNWLVSGEVNYLFSKNVKEYDLFNNMVSSGGYLGTTGGSPGNYLVNLRGVSGFVRAGRLFAFNKRNMNSGILVKAGVGYIQHHINIFTHDGNIPQIDNNYAKGYDRYTTGFAINEFIGYSYQSANRLINVYIGVDLMQAKTYNRRQYNYDQMAFDTGSKKDFATTFRLGWMIPIYLNTKDENEFHFR